MPLSPGPRAISISRKIVQCCFALYAIYIGYRFYNFYLWAVGRSQIHVQRPSSVEAFLPISALVGLKQFLFTGVYDFVHPAGLTILLAALAISFLLRRGFCGWICPIGLLSEIMAWIGAKTGICFSLSGWKVYSLYAVKYLLLGFFIYIIFWKMDSTQATAFLRSPYNLTADGRMLLFFLQPGRTAVVVLVLLMVFSLLIRNFWCRFACPYGALLGLAAWAGPLYVRRDPKKCASCMGCARVCPASIEVYSKERIRLPECIGCMECVEACPEKGCLGPVAAGRFRINPYAVGAAVVLFFLGSWLAAQLTGHWDSRVPAHMWIRFYSIFMAR